MSIRNIGIRSVGSLLCSFVLFTVVWILWGFLTPGDFFGNGSLLVKPSLAVGAIVGLITGFRAGGRWRIFVFGVAIASHCEFMLLDFCAGRLVGTRTSMTTANEIVGANAGLRLQFAGKSQACPSPRPGVPQLGRSLRHEVAFGTAWLEEIPDLALRVAAGFHGSMRLAGCGLTATAARGVEPSR